MSPFINPWLAWAGIGLASIPIIIHLINRRRLRRLDWAAMEFLLLALKKNRRRIQLEHLILLLCRIVLMVLIALFLARPFLSDRGLGWLAGSLGSEEKVFVLDDSLSMDYQLRQGKVFGEATAAVSRALGQLAQQGTQDRVTLIKTSDPDHPLVRGGFITSERIAQQTQTIRDLSPTSTQMNLAATLESIAEYLAGAGQETAQRQRAIYVVTDLRAVDWTDGTGGPSAQLNAVFERLLEDEQNPPRLEVLDVGSEDVSNVALTDLSLESGRPTVDVPTEFRLDIRNVGAEEVTDLRLQLSFGLVSGDEQTAASVPGPQVARIPARETVSVSFTYTFRQPGSYAGRVELSSAGDRLTLDNRFHVVVDVARTTEVLVVDGEPSREWGETESFFLDLALSPSSDALSGIETFVVVEENLPRSELGRFGAIFLANVHSLPEDFRDALGRYVRVGGALVIFLGDQVRPAVYDREFGAAARKGEDSGPASGLLPAAVGEVTGDAPVGLKPAFDHEFFRSLDPSTASLFLGLEFEHYFALESAETARVIATFADAADSPAIVEHFVGSGRVILIASSADREWNDWGPNPTFPVFVQEVMATLGRRLGRGPDHVAGAPIVLAADIALNEKEARYRPPDYPQSAERTLIAAPASEDDAAVPFRFVLEETSKAGLGQLALRKRDGEEVWSGLAIRSAPEESDLTRIDPGKIQQLYPDVPLRIVQGPDGFSDTGKGRLELADVLLVLLILLLFVEGVLACRFARHVRSPRSSLPTLGTPKGPGGAS